MDCTLYCDKTFAEFITLKIALVEVANFSLSEKFTEKYFVNGMHWKKFLSGQNFPAYGYQINGTLLDHLGYIVHVLIN